MRTGIKPAGLRLGVSLGFVAKHTANLSKDLVNAVNAGIVYKHTVMNADEQVVNAVIDENQDVIVYAKTGEKPLFCFKRERVRFRLGRKLKRYPKHDHDSAVNPLMGVNSFV